MKLSDRNISILQMILNARQQGASLIQQGQTQLVNAEADLKHHIEQCAQVMGVDYPATHDFSIDGFEPKKTDSE